MVFCGVETVEDMTRAIYGGFIVDRQPAGELDPALTKPCMQLFSRILAISPHI